MYTRRTTKAGTVRLINYTAVLDTYDGTHILRRVGKDSKRLEEVFQKLVGRYLMFSGRIVRQYFFVSSWCEVTKEEMY